MENVTFLIDKDVVAVLIEKGYLRRLDICDEVVSTIKCDELMAEFFQNLANLG